MTGAVLFLPCSHAQILAALLRLQLVIQALELRKTQPPSLHGLLPGRRTIEIEYRGKGDDVTAGSGRVLTACRRRCIVCCGVRRLWEGPATSAAPARSMRVRFVVPDPVFHQLGQLGQGGFLQAALQAVLLVPHGRTLRCAGYALEQGGQLGQRENRFRLPALARLQDGGGGNNTASGQHGNLRQIDGKAFAAHHRHPVRDSEAAGIDGPNHGVDRADHGVNRNFRDIGQPPEQVSEYVAYALPGKLPISGEYSGNEIEQPGKYADDIFYDGGRDLYGALQAVDQRQTRDLESRAQDTGQQRG